MRYVHLQRTGRRATTGYSEGNQGGATMRKRIIASDQAATPPADDRSGVPPTDDWLDLEELAEVEISSEDADHPIEAALLPGRSSGWRAAGPGTQTIRLSFAEPVRLRRIWLDFVEPSRERTQQFLLQWSTDGGRSFQDVVRQQWNFSPGDGSRETEDFRVDLDAVSTLELQIVPDISGGSAEATLAHLRLA